MPASPVRESLWTRDFVFIFIINFCIVLCGNMLLPIFPFFLVSLGGNEITTGTAAVVYSACSLIMRPLAGWLLDNTSRSRAFFFALIGALLIPPLQLVVLSIGGAVALRGLYGAALSVCSTSSSTNACDVVPASRFGEGIGFFGLTNSISNVVGPALGLFLYQGLGWLPVFGLASLMALTCLVLIRFFHFRPLPQKAPAPRPDSAWGWLGLLFDYRAVPATLLIWLSYIPAGAISSFMALYAQMCGLANPGWLFSFQALGTASGRIFFGKQADVRGEGPAIYASAILFTCGMLLMVFGGLAWTFFLGSYLHGLAFGILMPAMQTMSVRVVPPERRGAASSTYMCAWDLAVGVGGMLGGLLITWLGYRWMFCLLTLTQPLTVWLYRVWGRYTPAAFRAPVNKAAA